MVDPEHMEFSDHEGACPEPGTYKKSSSLKVTLHGLEVRPRSLR